MGIEKSGSWCCKGWDETRVLKRATVLDIKMSRKTWMILCGRVPDNSLSASLLYILPSNSRGENEIVI